MQVRRFGDSSTHAQESSISLSLSPSLSLSLSLARARARSTCSRKCSGQRGPPRLCGVEVGEDVLEAEAPLVGDGGHGRLLAEAVGEQTAARYPRMHTHRCDAYPRSVSRAAAPLPAARAACIDLARCAATPPPPHTHTHSAHRPGAAWRVSAGAIESLRHESTRTRTAGVARQQLLTWRGARCPPAGTPASRWSSACPPAPARQRQTLRAYSRHVTHLQNVTWPGVFPARYAFTCARRRRSQRRETSRAHAPISHPTRPSFGRTQSPCSTWRS